MNSVLITGSNGFLGQFVARACVGAGYDVCGIDLSPPTSAVPWNHVSGDATDPAILIDLAQGCDILIHIAAIPRPIGRAGGDVFRINMGAVYAALEGARLARVKRFIYASSFSVLGYPFFEKPIQPAYLPIDEDHPIQAQDIYATSKWLGEEMIEAFVRRGSFAAVSLRMPWIQMPDTFDMQIKPRRLNDQQAQAMAARDLWAYLDARDAAAAFIAAIQAKTQGHLRLFLSAPDTYMEQPSAELVANFYPDSVQKSPLIGHESLINCARSREILNFTPLYSWRQYG